MPWFRRAVPVLVALTAVAPLLAACAGSGYRYVENGDEGAYFKVPDGWELYEVDFHDTLPTDRPLPDGAELVEGPWRVVFDSAPDPSVNHIDELQPEHVVGQAEIGAIRTDRRDTLTLADLRSLVLGGEADPIDLYEQGSTDLELVDYEEIATADGLRGNRIVVNVRLQGDDFVTIDQVALVDAATETFYRFLVKCDAACYRDHRDQIDTIVDSWTVEP